MSSADPFERYSTLHLFVTHFEANRRIIRIKTQKSMIGFSNGQADVYLECRLKEGSLPWYSIADILKIENQTFRLERMVHNTLFLEPLQKVSIEGEAPTHIASRSDTHIDDTT